MCEAGGSWSKGGRGQRSGAYGGWVSVSECMCVCVCEAKRSQTSPNVAKRSQTSPKSCEKPYTCSIKFIGA